MVECFDSTDLTRFFPTSVHYHVKHLVMTNPFTCCDVLSLISHALGTALCSRVI